MTTRNAHADDDGEGMRRGITSAQAAVAFGVLLVAIVAAYIAVLRLTRPAIPAARPVEITPVAQEEYRGEPEPAPTPGTPGQLSHADELRQEELQMLRNSALQNR